MNYRKKTRYVLARLPEIFIEAQRGKKPPCNTCNQLVLASETSSKTYENDKKGVFLRKNSSGDIINFTIEKGGVVLPNLGVDGIFPNDNMTVGFVYDWKQYLLANGVGCYTIKCNFEIAGVSDSYIVGVFQLKKFSFETSNKTVRVWSKFNSYSMPNLVDFTDSNFEDMIRFNGFFGNRKPETEITNFVNKGNVSDSVKRENLNKYELRTDPLNECRTRQLLDFHFLHEDEIFISDYNRTNHSYRYNDKAVILSDTPETNYIDGDRGASITAIFSDKVLNQKSLYNHK